MTMTSRQRILTALRHEAPDRVPVSPFGLGHLDRDGDMARELIARTDPFLSAGLGGNAMMGSALQAETREEGNDRIAVIQTPAGPLTQRFRRTDITSAQVEFPCKGAADVEAYLSISFEPARPDPEAFLNYRREIGEDALVLAGIADAICLPASILSPEDMCLLWMDDPALLTHVCAVASGRLNAYVEEACKLGVDGFRIVGGEYATEQLGPVGYEALVKGFDTELVDIMHHYGAVAYYHNHGDVDLFLEGLADLGIDALDPLEVPPYGNVDLADARRRISDRVCLVGGLDDMEVLESRGEAEVKEMGRRCIEMAGPSSYCLGGTASGTYTEVAARNFIALVGVAEEMAG